jgi:uncharacterized protein YqeY
MIQQIKQDIIKSMKNKDSVRTSILRLVVSECDLINARTGKVTDQDVIKVIEKFIGSIDETIALTKNEKALVNLRNEIYILESYLPLKLTVEEIKEKLDREVIISCKNDGMAMGAAMKSLKGLFFDSSDVKLVVEKIRNGS